METNKSKGAYARAKALSQEERIEIAEKAARARWGYKAYHKGNFSEDFGIDADCYVLDDEMGTAVLTQNGMGNLLGFSGDRPGRMLFRFVHRESVWSRLGQKTQEKIENPIKFQYIDRGQNGDRKPPFSASGYDATVLIDICNSILFAKRVDAGIPDSLVANAGVVTAASAKLGIQALVYKLAGYNSTKAQVIAAFRQYVQEEARKWAKEFPDDLYAEWQRIYNIPVPVRGRNWEHRHLTVRHVYTPLARSNGRLLTLLREAKGEQKTKRLHQFLTEVGVNALRSHIWQVVGIAKSSQSIEQYEESIARAFGGQLPLHFEDDGR